MFLSTSDIANGGGIFSSCSTISENWYSSNQAGYTFLPRTMFLTVGANRLLLATIFGEVFAEFPHPIACGADDYGKLQMSELPDGDYSAKGSHSGF
jgi:hypothetical protein